MGSGSQLPAVPASLAPTPPARAPSHQVEEPELEDGEEDGEDDRANWDYDREEEGEDDDEDIDFDDEEDSEDEDLLDELLASKAG